MIIDSHAHISSSAFDTDRSDVLQRATAAGVGTIIEVGYDLESSRKAAALAAAEPMVRYAAGIQPFYAGKDDAVRLDELKEIIVAGNPVAIGEAGLDYHYDVDPVSQEKLFIKQLLLAGELGLPVIIHLRDADTRMLELIRQGVLDGLRGVLHCFSGGPELAEAALDKGFFISLPGTVTFKNYRNGDLAARLPLDRLLVETDAPYLTPVPHRGKRNEPAFITGTIEKIAALRGIPAAMVAERTALNAATLFGLEVAA